MGLLQKLKSTLGLGGSRSRGGPDRTGDVDVRVEHEPAAESEAAVKGTDDGPGATPADEGSVAEGASTAETESAEPAEPESTASVASEATESTDSAESDSAEPASAESDSAEPASDDAEVSASADVPVDDLSGIGAAYAERLGNAGIESVAALADADAETVAEESDIAQGRVEGWIEQAREY